MTDLTDRMRTCAAAIVAGAPDKPFMEWQLVYRDAAALLVAAAHEIDVLTGPIDMGEPMEVIEPPPPGFAIDRTPTAMWTTAGDTLPTVSSGTVSPRACPRCDSRANKTVRRVDRVLMLTCPACGHQWPYK